MKPLPKVRFQEWECDLLISHYNNGGAISMRLMDREGPLATATVNVPDVKLDKDSVILKDGEENAGMGQAFVDSGIGVITAEGAVGHGTRIVVLKVTHPEVLAAIEKHRKTEMERPSAKNAGPELG